MSVAAIRPDSWNFPLLLHVGGAMLIVGVLVTVAGLLFAARKGDAPALTRASFRVMLFAGIPSYLLMRVGAEIVASEENVSDDSTWIGIGYITSDLGGLFIIIATVLAGVGSRRLRSGDGERSRSGAVAAGLTVVTLAAYLVAIWAMATKPA